MATSAFDVVDERDEHGATIVGDGGAPARLLPAIAVRVWRAANSGASQPTTSADAEGDRAGGEQRRPGATTPTPPDALNVQLRKERGEGGADQRVGRDDARLGLRARRDVARAAPPAAERLVGGGGGARQKSARARDRPRRSSDQERRARSPAATICRSSVGDGRRGVGEDRLLRRGLQPIADAAAPRARRTASSVSLARLDGASRDRRSCRSSATQVEVVLRDVADDRDDDAARDCPRWRESRRAPTGAGGAAGPTDRSPTTASPARVAGVARVALTGWRRRRAATAPTNAGEDLLVRRAAVDADSDGRARRCGCARSARATSTRATASARSKLLASASRDERAQRLGSPNTSHHGRSANDAASPRSWSRKAAVIGIAGRW